MVNETKIEAALEQEVAGITGDPRMWDRVRQGVLNEAASEPTKPGFWRRWRFGAVFRVAAVCIVMIGFVAIISSKPEGPAPGGWNGQPITGANPGSSVPGLDEISKQVFFSIFVPTEVPAGFIPQPPISPTGAASPLVKIQYHKEDGSVGLVVTNGPGGCCLDSDSRKAVGATAIRNSITGYFLVNQPEFGGHILWWNEAGSYVAMSGPDLTKEELVRIAASMSSSMITAAAQTVLWFAERVTKGDSKGAANLLAPE